MSEKVLLIDGGGRGHAIARKFVLSPRLGKLYSAPGNGGTAQCGENVPLKATDIDGLLAFAKKEHIDFTFVGQDDPLGLGIVDRFQANGLRICGPTRTAFEIEGSKAFSKGLMVSAGIPTASFNILRNYSEALRAVREHFAVSPAPLVLKADGLALGKGAYVCRTLAQAEQALDELMVERRYGSAGDIVIAEEFIPGPEVSSHAFCDGATFKMFPSAQDHKPVYDNDEGPNTGGTGTISPVPWFRHQGFAAEKVIAPALSALKDMGRPFKGILYPGFKMAKAGPTVLEFNARLGDPETQVYMRRLETDLLAILEACEAGRLGEMNIAWSLHYVVCVVMMAEGYPSPDYRRGDPIRGIREAERIPGVVVYHAGTTRDGEALKTSGGRVLGVTGVGPTLRHALDLAYAGVKCIKFEGMHYRKDIGEKSLMYGHPVA